MKTTSILLLALIVATAYAQLENTGLIPEPPPTPTNSGPAQMYWLGPKFGFATIQPMSVNGHQWGELIMSNSYGCYSLHDRSVTNSAGVILGYERDSYLPPIRQPVVMCLTFTDRLEFSTDLTNWHVLNNCYFRNANLKVKTP